MPKSPDNQTENPPLPLSPETTRGRQRFFYATAALGLTALGAATLVAGEIGYLNGYPSVILGVAFLGTAIMAARNYRSVPTF